MALCVLLMREGLFFIVLSGVMIQSFTFSKYWFRYKFADLVDVLLAVTRVSLWVKE